MRERGKNERQILTKYVTNFKKTLMKAQKHENSEFFLKRTERAFVLIFSKSERASDGHQIAVKKICFFKCEGVEFRGQKVKLNTHFSTPSNCLKSFVLRVKT